MEKKFIGKSGTAITFITEKVNREIRKSSDLITNKRDKKNSYSSGTVSLSDRRNIGIGLDILERIVQEGFYIQEKQLLSGEQDVTRIQKDISSYKILMQELLRRLSIGARDEYELQKRIELLSEYSKIAQAARDGIILKQQKRTETIDGEKKEITYDTSMTPREVMSILMDYERKEDKLKFDKLNNYIGLGLGIAGTIGTLVSTSKKKDTEKGNGDVPLIALGSTAIGALKLLQGVVIKKEDRYEQHELRHQGFRMRDDFLENEHISSNAEEADIKRIEDLTMIERKFTHNIENKKLAFHLVLDLAVALISGAYINKSIQVKQNGKIDGRSLATALVRLQSARGIASNFTNAVQGIVEGKKEEEQFEELCKKVRDILEQMEEKVYPLEGARKPFDSIKINDFTGKFYPKKNYETGGINFSTIIKVPEFSMKRGDIVLLSGESGTGKSTFLRFLKRGDINNRKAIQLDNGEMVDNFGDEYISFRPSINLGDETSVLSQITGKWSISDLTEEERKKLINMLRELKFDSPNLLEDLANKKFMEFSTGQQRRLALSKIFYRINDGTSVIIVDEPVDNVEDSLIREQLEMIKKYAESRNVMLILTTHRLDLAEDLVTKRYNINKEGVLEQIPIKNKTKNNVDR